MLNQLSRKLKSSHLLILIAIIIIAIIAKAISNYIHPSDINLPLKPEHSLAIPATTTAAPTHQPTVAETTTHLKASPPLPKQIQTPDMGWQTITVKPGDTTSGIFSRLGIAYAELEKVIQLPNVKKNLSSLQIGQNLHFKLNAHQQLQKLRYAFNDLSTLMVQRQGNHFTAKVNTKPLETRLVFKEFTIHGSLAASFANAGVSSDIYTQIHRILSSSVNFNRNIQPGDHFAILFQELYLNNRKYHSGDVMLTDLKGKQEHVTAVRYTDPHGNSDYYTPNGDSLKVAMFLSSPLHYDHISSYFSLHRLDPYIHKYHPHLGVDYAAPAGTPIHSVGDGVIAFRGWDNGYGNAVIVKYGTKYKALYGHMQRFASNQRVGQHVNKGQVIGYVGETGWATGDHLHFGWYINNIPYDPLKFKTAQPMPIPAQYRRDFLAESRTLLGQLELYKSTKFAENKINDSIADSSHHS